MKKYYFTGVSGTGKSTITAELKKRGLNAFDLDDGFCSWKNIETGKEADPKDKDNENFYNENDWYCNIEKLQELISQQKDTIFVFGTSANQDDFLKLFDRVFLLKCTPEIFTQRITSRTNNSYGKRPSELENELRWFEEFNTHLIEQGSIIIDTEKPIEAVADEIVSRTEI
jgi:adenylate kinase family enzyme